MKDPVSAEYGHFIHEGKQLDPVCRDIEALLTSSQAARHAARSACSCGPGSLFVQGVTSPHSLMAVSRGKYGEAAGEWTPADALGFSKIMALPGHVPYPGRRAMTCARCSSTRSLRSR